jgi:hypothetical protein
MASRSMRNRCSEACSGDANAYANAFAGHAPEHTVEHPIRMRFSMRNRCSGACSGDASTEIRDLSTTVQLVLLALGFLYHLRRKITAAGASAGDFLSGVRA